MGVRDVASPEPGGEAVLGVVRACRDLLEVVERHCDQHRAEDLLAGDPHPILDLREERGSDEVAVAVLGRPAGDRLRALLEPGVDVALDALELLGRDERAELRLRVEPGADRGVAGVAREPLDHLVKQVARYEQARAGVARLARVR